MPEVELKDVRYRSNNGDGNLSPGYQNPGFKSDSLASLPRNDNQYNQNETLSNKDDFNSQEDGREKGAAELEISEKDIRIGVEDVDIDQTKEPHNAVVKRIGNIQSTVYDTATIHKTVILRIILIVVLILYAVYFCYAMYCRFGDPSTAPEWATCLRMNETSNHLYGVEGANRLLWVTCVVLFFIILTYLIDAFGEKIYESIEPYLRAISKHGRVISWVLAGSLYLAVIIFVIVDVAYISKQPYNLVSLSGLVFYVLIFFIFSVSPAHVNWRAVVWGLGMQLIFALIILRWDWGYEAFKWLGARVSEFLEYSDAGAEFVFGKEYAHHFFAFKVLPVIVFFSTAISVLYYLGVMQVVIRKVAWVMQFAMGTTAAESLNAAGNIFIGQTEAPLMIRPLIQDMTKSEMHAVMTGGFATIAGSVMATYILFGVPANHLISASVMSAPAALAMSKLFYPETEESKTTTKHVAEMGKSQERNIIEAASAGASQSIKLIANIAANLIAFLAMLAFLNATLTWFGHRVGIKEFTFEFICSYLLWPLAVLMGVNIPDCRKVATLLGIKTFLNEFIAYTSLAVYIKNGEQLANYNGTLEYINEDIFLVDANTTLTGGVLSPRSEVIATYALCGFSNVGSMGIMLGGLGAMAPHRKSDMASIVFRAMLAGNVACFMTACIAGLFYQGEM